jgi:hypothetical protein
VAISKSHKESESSQISDQSTIIASTSESLFESKQNFSNLFILLILGRNQERAGILIWMASDIVSNWSTQ